MLWATVAAGASTLLVGGIVAGPVATLDWLRFVANRGIDEVWTNASLPAEAARLFTENELDQSVATLPFMVPLAFALAAGIVALTALRVARLDPETGLWALVAASLLLSPIAWHGYMVLLGPGILVLLARGFWAPAVLLLALGTLPNEWALLWREANPVVESLALTLYACILLAHWLALFFAAHCPPPRTHEAAPVEGGK